MPQHAAVTTSHTSIVLRMPRPICACPASALPSVSAQTTFVFQIAANDEELPTTTTGHSPRAHHEPAPLGSLLRPVSYVPPSLRVIDSAGLRRGRRGRLGGRGAV